MKRTITICLDEEIVENLRKEKNQSGIINGLLLNYFEQNKPIEEQKKQDIQNKFLEATKRNLTIRENIKSLLAAELKKEVPEELIDKYLEGNYKTIYEFINEEVEKESKETIRENP